MDQLLLKYQCGPRKGFSAQDFLLVMLRNRLQGTQTNNCDSSWSEMLFAVPQGLILQPILSNIILGELTVV